MRGSAMLKAYAADVEETTTDEARQADQFAIALTELSREYGIGITGGTVFVMEPEDLNLSYVVGDQSQLTFG